MINHNVAQPSCDVIIQFAGERIVKIGVNIWRNYKQNGWLCHKPHSPYTFAIKDEELDS